MQKSISATHNHSSRGERKSSISETNELKPKTIRMTKRTNLSIKLAADVEECNLGQIVEQAIDDFISKKHPDLVPIVERSL